MNVWIIYASHTDGSVIEIIRDGKELQSTIELDNVILIDEDYFSIKNIIKVCQPSLTPARLTYVVEVIEIAPILREDVRAQL
ncbi:hypothetical protein D1872_38210 [compost metagenome]